MKKVLLLGAILTLGFSANAFAAGADTGVAGAWTAATGGETLLNNLLSIKPSANIKLAYKHHANATGAIESYSIGTLHTSGTFVYGTSSTDTNIYRNTDIATPATIPDAPTTATAGVTWTGWTASK